MQVKYIILFSFITANIVCAQNYDYSVSGMINKGFILRHSREIGIAGNSFPTNFIADIDRHHYGNKSWEKLRNYPDLGISINIVNYHSSILGWSVGLSPYYKKNIAFNRQFLQLKIGLGMGYHNNPYDKELNHQNQLLGSSFSFSIPLGIQYRFLINDKLQLLAGVNVIHFSNGAIKKPNKGINVVSSGMGIGYKFNKNIEIQEFKKTKFKPNNSWYLSINGGFHEPNYVGAGSKPFINGSFYRVFEKKMGFQWLAGGDIFMSYALKEDIKYDLKIQGKKPDFKRAAATLGFEYLINNISLIGQLGVYVYDPYKAYGWFYERLGLKFKWSESIYSSITVKAHYANAEMAEFGIGFKL